MSTTPRSKAIPSVLISQENVGRIRNHLQIVLCEVSLVRRQEKLAEHSLERLRVTEREVKSIANLLPGDKID